MGGENDGVLLTEGTDKVSDLNDLLGVKTDGGLVKDDDGRVSDECLRDAHTLLVTLGEVLEHSVVDVRDLNDLADLAEVLFLIELTVLEVVSEGEIFRDSHIGVEGRLLGEISDQSFCIQRVVENINAADLDRAGGGGEIAREHIHRGTLSRAVRTEESEDLALSDLKADIVHGGKVAVVFHQVRNFNHFGDPFN